MICSPRASKTLKKRVQASKPGGFHPLFPQNRAFVNRTRFWFSMVAKTRKNNREKPIISHRKPVKAHRQEPGFATYIQNQVFSWNTCFWACPAYSELLEAPGYITSVNLQYVYKSWLYKDGNSWSMPAHISLSSQAVRSAAGANLRL